MSFLEICIVAFVGFCSGVIKTGVGIGAGIFLLPTLSLAFPAKTALGLGAPLLLASDILGMFYYWKQWVTLGEIARLMGAALPGMLLGTLLLPVISSDGFRMAVGLFGMVYAVNHLFPLFTPVKLLKKSLAEVNERIEGGQIYIYGAIGGVATVLAHAGGLVWSLYLLTAARDRRAFVGTIVLLFFITNIYKVVAYIAIGTIPASFLIDLLPAVPAVWVGSALGNHLNKCMNPDLFKKIVLVIIFLVSAKLCF